MTTTMATIIHHAIFLSTSFRKARAKARKVARKVHNHTKVSTSWFLPHQMDVRFVLLSIPRDVRADVDAFTAAG